MPPSILQRMNSTIELCVNWPALLANKSFSKLLKFNAVPVRSIKLKNGLSLRVENNELDTDLFILGEIWHDHLYNPPLFSIKPEDIVVDIGANKGYFALYAAKLANKGRVYCFEPTPHLYKLINDNIKANGITNVFPQQAAVYSKNGTISFYVEKTNNAAHSMYGTGSESEKIEVKTVTLPQFCEENKISRISFLKMDCEGAEYEILFNLPKEFLQRIDKIAMEYHDSFNEHKHPELVDFFQKNGFATAVHDVYIYALNKEALR